MTDSRLHLSGSDTFPWGSELGIRCGQFVMLPDPHVHPQALQLPSLINICIKRLRSICLYPLALSHTNAHSESFLLLWLGTVTNKRL